MPISGPRARPQLPGVLEDRDADDRKLGAAGADSRATCTSAIREPGDRYRVILVADGFATHIKIAGERDPQSADRAADIQLPGSPAEPADGLQPPHLRIRARHPRDADPVRLLRGPQHVQAMGRSPRRPDRRPSSSPSKAARTGPPARAQPRGFAPTFSAASAGNTGGAHSPFGVEIGRADGEQNLSGIQITTPPGFSATLKGIPYCPESAIAPARAAPGYTGRSELASPACPSASQVGTATVGAGSGSRPLYTSGKVYLAGPYKGAPLSLVVVVPAVSGPYDLGNVVVRVASERRPGHGSGHCRSDPLPQILEGIPLRTRSIQVDLNRPDFTLNPTNCEPLAVDARRSPATKAGRAARQLPGRQLRDPAVPPEARPEALRRARQARAPGDPRDLHRRRQEKRTPESVTPCCRAASCSTTHTSGRSAPRPAFVAGTCPGDSLVGTANGATPLLGNPLTGNVYLLANQKHGCRISPWTSRVRSASR